MKRIINGKKYDTETAKEKAYASNGAAGSFSYYAETLYKKKTGEFFLYGEGGPLTEYSQKCSDGSIGWGKKIVPLTETEAKEWAEQNANEKYEEIFWEVEE